jgi:hypothetical protein
VLNLPAQSRDLTLQVLEPLVKLLDALTHVIVRSALAAPALDLAPLVAPGALGASAVVALAALALRVGPSLAVTLAPAGALSLTVALGAA